MSCLGVHSKVENLIQCPHRVCYLAGEALNFSSLTRPTPSDASPLLPAHPLSFYSEEVAVTQAVMMEMQNHSPHLGNISCMCNVAWLCGIGDGDIRGITKGIAML